MVYQLALNLLGDRDEALDLSQEVFLRVFRTIHSFRGQSALKTWIYRIVVNQARNRQRLWRRRHRADQVSLDQHVAAHGDLPPARRSTPRPTAPRPKAAGRAAVAGARPPAVRSAHRDRAARNRRPELRRDRLLARRRGRHREVAADARAPGAARRAAGGPAMMHATAVRRRAGSPRGVPRRRADASTSASPSRATCSDCVTCALVADELADLGRRLARPAGHGVRTATRRSRAAAGHVHRAAATSKSSSRCARRSRDWFQDMHLVWAGLGATVATLDLRRRIGQRAARRQPGAPDSLARAISVLASPGSNENPLRLNYEMDRAARRQRRRDRDVRKRTRNTRCRPWCRAKAACRASKSSTTAPIGRASTRC